MPEMETLWAEQALTAAGWQREVRVEIAGNGRIAAIEPGSPRRGVASAFFSPRRSICTATHFSVRWRV